MTHFRQWGLDALGDHVGAKVYLEQMAKQEKFVWDFKLEPIDVKKALKTLETNPKA